ncbi:unnamed protein product [Cuscuta epithymum]|uniref:Uncharacterized protein n=1 Tax=Cuscuta epithymum TaxID=186058 RepID=A0AAV0E642_9ASTE|nr:unnamed protein product [Cuscuta epithymum]
MEDLWEDINLSSLHHLKPPAPHGVALHEFLGRPFAAQNTPPPPSLSLCSNVPEIHFSCGPADAHTSVLPHHYSVSPDGRRIAASSPVSSGRRKRGSPITQHSPPTTGISG